MTPRVYVPSQRCGHCMALGYQCAIHAPEDRSMVAIKVIGAVITIVCILILITALVTQPGSSPYRQLDVNGVHCYQQTADSNWVCP